MLYLVEKTAKFLPEDLYFLAVDELFVEVLLLQEIYPTQKNCCLHPWFYCVLSIFLIALNRFGIYFLQNSLCALTIVR